MRLAGRLGYDGVDLQATQAKGADHEGTQCGICGVPGSGWGAEGGWPKCCFPVGPSGIQEMGEGRLKAR
jgi:hypothetical protein